MAFGGAVTPYTLEDLTPPVRALVERLARSEPSVRWLSWGSWVAVRVGDEDGPEEITLARVFETFEFSKENEEIVLLNG